MPTLDKSSRRVLVTRPAREAAQWVQALSESGFEAKALPLMVIGPPHDTAPLHAAWARLRTTPETYGALMFVSPNAVSGFFESVGGTVAAERLADRVRAWSPGPGTTRALHETGWPAAAIDAPPPESAQFDSETLWNVVSAQAHPGQQVLIVRGTNECGQVAGRSWLAEQLRGASVVVDEVASYRRERPTFDALQLQLAKAGAAGLNDWIFSSSEAIANLCTLLPGQDWSAAAAVATHARIAKAALEAGFGRVVQTTPTLEAVAASIESLHE